jgi:hypothetical protein
VHGIVGIGARVFAAEVDEFAFGRRLVGGGQVERRPVRPRLRARLRRRV